MKKIVIISALLAVGIVIGLEFNNIFYNSWSKTQQAKLEQSCRLTVAANINSNSYDFKNLSTEKINQAKIYVCECYKSKVMSKYTYDDFFIKKNAGSPFDIMTIVTDCIGYAKNKIQK